MVNTKLSKIFEANNGILTTQMAKDAGIDSSTLRKAAERNDIQRHSRGIYLLDESYYDDLYLLQLKYPKGVYSHETAVMLHWLSTSYPFSYHISFPRGYHLTNAKDQNIRPHYLPEKELKDKYVTEVDSWDRNPIKVTNLEKTIIDMMRYEKITPGILEELIDDYLDREEKNIRRLEEYAKLFKMENLIEERILAFVK